MRKFKFEMMLSVTGFVSIEANSLEEATMELINTSWDELRDSMGNDADYDIVSATDENGDDVEY